MHVILGLLGTVVTILILLNRLAEAGIDLAGLNPFLWQRRRHWRDKYAGDPLFRLEEPMEVASLLTVAAAKCDGDMSSEEKRLILSLFQEEFNVSRKEASGLMISGVYLLKDPAELIGNLAKVIAPSKEKFTPAQVLSVVQMITKVSNEGGPCSDTQEEFLNAVTKELNNGVAEAGKWNTT